MKKKLKTDHEESALVCAAILDFTGKKADGVFKDIQGAFKIRLLENNRLVVSLEDKHVINEGEGGRGGGLI